VNYSSPTPAFSLRSLADSVYQHVRAWREALESCRIQLSVWRIHRRMGMSGGLFTAALLRETGRPGAYRVYQDPRDLLEHPTSSARVR
jgi:hypothetical protein